jgi:phosphoribosylanthranilate isomerase
MPNPTSLVKICGVTQLEQALAIAELGADFIGLNFWPHSKRYLPLDKATVFGAVPPTARIIGVFVNPDQNDLNEAAATGILSGIQLHGDETPEFCLEAQRHGLPVIKAFQVRDPDMIHTIADYPQPDILLDAYHPHERGGVGATFPWGIAATFREQNPARRLYLAGGLTAENVGAAVQGVNPYAVDVASGVEGQVPGIKDLAKVARFIAAARGES